LELRRIKQEHTRERMMSVAFQLFRDQGYDDVTVEMIAAATGVSPRTFYRYFHSKDGIFARSGLLVADRALERIQPGASVSDLIRELAGALEEMADDSYLDDVVRLLRENPRLAHRAHGWRQRWADHLADGLAAMDGTAPTFDHRVTSTVAIQVAALAADEWLHRVPDRRISDLARDAVLNLR
jgi:AcrR family transcriptional regulator